MPRGRLSMRKVEDVLRLRWGAGLSPRQIAKSVGIGRTTVSEYIARAEAAGITKRVSPHTLRHYSASRTMPSAPGVTLV